MQSLPHRYYEENNLHGFLIEQLGEYTHTTRMLEQFLPYVDNWATCDMMRPSVFRHHLPELLPRIYNWMQSDQEYTVRYGIEMLMCHFLEEDFSIEQMYMAMGTPEGEYYVDMMVAWYMATALAKQWDEAVKVLENRVLSPWRHNKTVQKACESLRISKEKKIYLKGMRV